MRQAGMRRLSPQHTHRPARVSGNREAWSGRCVFRLNGKWYDAAMNVVVIHGVQEGLALVSTMHLTASVIIGGRGIRPPPRHHGMGRATRTRKSRLSPSPDRRGQRRCPPQKPLAASPGRPAHHQRQDRLWSRASSLLLRIRWATHQTGHRQGHRGVKRRSNLCEGGRRGLLILMQGTVW